MKKCPHCSQLVKDEATLCKHCKRDIRKQVKKGWLFRIILVTAIGIILTFVFRVYYLTHKGVEPVSPSIESKLEANEIAKGENLMPFYDENQIGGYKNKLTGEIVIEPQFSLVEPFSDGRALIGIGEVIEGSARKQGFINPEGEIIIKPKFCMASSFSEGLARVYFCETQKAGYINKDGVLVIDAVFDNANSFSDNLAAVELRGVGWGFINHKGLFAIEPYFDFASSFSEGLALVGVGGKYGYINVIGSFVINPQFEYVGDQFSSDFKNGIANVKREGKFFYINKKGEVVNNPSL